MSPRGWKEHRRFFAALAVLALVAVGEGWWVAGRREAVSRAREQWAMLDREARGWSPVDEETVKEGAEELARWGQELAGLQAAEEAGRGMDIASLPANRAEAFFALGEFVETMRERAADCGVAIAAEERFGFAEYAQTGPGVAEIERVFRERRMAESLLTALFEARPGRFLGLERREGGGESTFEILFESRTDTLRALLNGFAADGSPAKVRSVEAQRVEARDAWRGRGEERAGPLVGNRDMRFAVVVEWRARETEERRGGETARETEAERWRAPAPQRRGEAWVFHVFEPPEVFYDPMTERFSVAPPVPLPMAMASPRVAETFALELVEVRHAAFRLQLIGYVGDEGAYRGLFENGETGETLLAVAGHEVPGLDVRIEQFAVERVTVPLADSMTTRRRVATASVRDERTGETVQLSSLERRLAGEPFAVVTLRGTAQRRDVREGDAVEVGGEVYRIARIQAAPPALELSCESAGSAESERRTLTARRSEAASSEPTS